MPKKRAIIDFEMIWKKIDHSLTEEEELLLSQWLDESPLHQKYLDDATQYYLRGSSFNANKAETKKVWETLKNNKLRDRKNYMAWSIPAVAAALVVVAAIYFLPAGKTTTTPVISNQLEIIKPGTNKARLILNDGSVYDLSSSKSLVLTEGGSEIKSEGTTLQYSDKKNDNQNIAFNTLSVPRGGEFSLQLADGTKVWLNSETTLKYPVRFAGNERKVELSGEAFFEVAKNETVPFLVESGEQIVKVLGTEFNISSYKENPAIYTTLVKGSVEVSVRSKPEIRQKLAPNEQSAMSKADEKLMKQQVDPYPYVAWKDGRFVL